MSKLAAEWAHYARLNIAPHDKKGVDGTPPGGGHLGPGSSHMSAASSCMDGVLSQSHMQLPPGAIQAMQGHTGMPLQGAPITSMPLSIASSIMAAHVNSPVSGMSASGQLQPVALHQAIASSSSIAAPIAAHSVVASLPLSHLNGPSKGGGGIPLTVGGGGGSSGLGGGGVGGTNGNDPSGGGGASHTRPSTPASSELDGGLSSPLHSDEHSIDGVSKSSSVTMAPGTSGGGGSGVSMNSLVPVTGTGVVGGTGGGGRGKRGRPSKSLSLTGQKHTLLTLEQKMELIRAYEEDKVKVRSLMELFSCGKTQVYAILRHRTQIKHEYERSSTTQERMVKRKARFTGNEEINEIVYRWYVDARSRNIPVTGPQLKERARIAADALGRRDFKASNGWLEGFRKRHQVMLPKGHNRNNAKQDDATRAARKGIRERNATKQEEAARTARWNQEVMSMISGYDQRDIFACDVTTLYYQALPRGSKGPADFTQNRLTLLLCVNSLGERELPFIVGSVHLPHEAVMNLPLLYRRGDLNAHLTPYMIEEWLRILNEKLRRENRNAVIFLLLADTASYILRTPFTNLKLVQWLPSIASTQVLQQGAIYRFKLRYRMLALRYAISNSNHQPVSLMDALQYLSRAWHIDLPASTIQKCFWKAGFPVALSDLDAATSTAESSLAEDTKELQRLMDLVTNGHVEDAGDFIEVETTSPSLPRANPADEMQQHYGLQLYGGDFQQQAATGAMAQFEGVPITTYPTAINELRRLQQFAMKMNDPELQESVFVARVSAEKRHVARCLAEKYLHVQDGR